MPSSRRRYATPFAGVSRHLKPFAGSDQEAFWREMLFLVSGGAAPAEAAAPDSAVVASADVLERSFDDSPALVPVSRGC